MSDDIVTRLRVLLSKCCIAPAMGVWSRDLRDAADEIETLRSTVTDCRIEIERLRAERDEARRWYCIYARYHPAGLKVVDANGVVHLLTEISAEDHARARGWDCFKEASA